MPVQLNIFLLLFGGLQGLLFTIFLIRKKLYRQGYIFLLLYFAVLLLQIVLKVMSKGWLMHNWSMLYQQSYQLPFLYGPLIYLFARQQTGGASARQKDILHFVPFLITFLMLNLGSVAIADQLQFLFFEGERRLVLQLVSLGAYHWLAYRCWQQHTSSIKKYYSDIQKLQLRWLHRFIILSFALCTVIAFTIYFMYVFYPALNWLRMGFLSLTFFIYWVSYCALTQPDIFMVAQRQSAPEAVTLPRLEVHRAPEKYSNSGLGKEDAQRLASALEACMMSRKPYLEPDITIEKLAVLVSSNRHHLSQVLNDTIGLSFYEYVNCYRVSEAKALLTDISRKDHKIASIAYDAGFNSLSSFNEVFKKMTGYTPSQYRKLPPGSLVAAI
jgi:AraC-like DNA-binding protein